MTFTSPSVLQCRPIRQGCAPDWTPLKRTLEQLLRARVHTAQAMPPGTLVAAEEPVWQISLNAPASPADLAALQAAADETNLPMRTVTARHALQVYRQLNEQGIFIRDVMLALSAQPIPGMVLLQSVFAHSRWHAHNPTPRQAQLHHARQTAALPPNATTLPIVDKSRD